MRGPSFPTLLFLIGVPLLPAMAPAGDDAPYRVVERWKPGGEGGWDYLSIDPEARRLYIARATRVQVMDLDRGTLVGEVSDTPGVHGVALAPELGKGFASNGRDSTVTVFDLKSLAAIGRIHLDARAPDAIVYDPVSRRVFATGHGSGTATAIDAASDRVVGTIPLGGTPEFAVVDDRGEVFVNLEDSSAVVGLDARSLRVQSRWALAPGQEPTGLAMDREHRRLFAGCHNERLIVLDADSGRVLAAPPIGRGVDATAFDPGNGRALASNGDGTLTVVHEDSPDRFTVVGSAQTQRGARTMALDPKTHRVYLATADFGPTPAATADNPHPRPAILPGSFVVLVLEPAR